MSQRQVPGLLGVKNEWSLFPPLPTSPPLHRLLPIFLNSVVFLAILVVALVTSRGTLKALFLGASTFARSLDAQHAR